MGKHQGAQQGPGGMFLDFYTKSLNITEPFYIKGINSDGEAHTLIILVDFRRDEQFIPAAGGEPVKAKSTVIKEWEHGQVNQDRCIIRAWVPKIPRSGGGYERMIMPWEGLVDGFTNLCEENVLSLLNEGLAVASASKILGIAREHLDKIVNAHSVIAKGTS